MGFLYRDGTPRVYLGIIPWHVLNAPPTNRVCLTYPSFQDLVDAGWEVD